MGARSIDANTEVCMLSAIAEALYTMSALPTDELSASKDSCAACSPSSGFPPVPAIMHYRSEHAVLAESMQLTFQG